MFKITEEHEALKRSLNRLIDNEINPFVPEWEEKEIFPAHDVFKKLGSLGLLGLTKPTKYGGSGLDYTFAQVMAETLGNIKCGGVPMAIGVQTDMATPALARYGSDDLKKEFLVPSITGEYVACLGVSEPSAGSDVAQIKTTARREGDDYVINGGKLWTTNGAQADWMCLLANTSSGGPHKSKTLICLPMNLPGVNVANKIKKIGMFSSDTVQIFFDSVRVPQRYRIGEEGLGFTYQMQQFQEERLWAASVTLQSLQRCIDETIEYARERKLFNSTVLDQQWVHYKIAECQTELEALRALTYRAVSLYIEGNDVTKLASMAKLKAGRLMRQITDICLQFWGGMGYTWENSVARAYRDGRLTSIGGGADEVMLAIISKQLGMFPTNSR